MSTTCCVPSCHGQSKITFHSPQSRAHLDLWKKVLKINHDQFYVCDQHFEEKFIRIEKRLTVDAFPTQFITDLDDNTNDYCQCCMKSFVRNRFLSQIEKKMQIEGNFQLDFEDVIGCEIPSGVVCKKCFDTIKNFVKFRNEIREKQAVRDEIVKLKAQQIQQVALDPNIKIKEEPKDDEEQVHMEVAENDSLLRIKDEPMDETSEYVIKQETISVGNDENFLISEIKAEPEEMNDLINKPKTVKVCRLASTNQIVIKRPNHYKTATFIRPETLKNFRVLPTHQIVKVTRPSTSTAVQPSAKISNNQGAIKISQVQLKQNENSPSMLGYKCQYCPNRFIERKFVVDHIKQKHTFPCNSCDSVFPFRITLIKHQMSTHGSSSANTAQQKPSYKYICRICGLKFLSNYTLDAHMLQRHNKVAKEKPNKLDENIIIIRPLQMPAKPKAQQSPQPSSSKMVTVKSTNPLIVPASSPQIRVKAEQSNSVVPIQFLKQEPVVRKPVRNLIQKILTPVAAPAEPLEEDPDGIPCLDCGLLLKPDKLLKHRMDAHDLNTHIMHYMCDLCGLEIRGKTQLINHITTKHLSENYVKCEFCDGLFENNTEVVCHKNLQHNFNGTRYTCHFCYKIFGSKREMILHRKGHYSEKDSRDKLARVFCKKFKSYEPKSAEYK